MKTNPLLITTLKTLITGLMGVLSTVTVGTTLSLVGLL